MYSIETHITRNTIEVLVSGLRRKLNEAGEPDVISTRRGFGYTIPTDPDHFDG
jgi:DNA-binding response OmpR family regulator